MLVNLTMLDDADTPTPLLAGFTFRQLLRPLDN